MKDSFAEELKRYLDRGVTLQYQRCEGTLKNKGLLKEHPVYYKRTHGVRSVDQPLFNDGISHLAI